MLRDSSGIVAGFATTGWARRHPLAAGVLPFAVLGVYIELALLRASFPGFDPLLSASTGVCAVLAMVAWACAYVPHPGFGSGSPGIRPVSFVPSVGFRKVRQDGWVRWSGAGLCAWLFAAGWSLMCQALTADPSYGQAMGSLLSHDWLDVVCTVVVIAPMFEEFLMRGCLQTWMLRTFTHLTPMGCVAVVALAFSLLHGNLTQIPGTFALGMVCGLAYLHTGNIFLAVGVHVANNLLGVLVGCVALPAWVASMAVCLPVMTVALFVGTVILLPYIHDAWER